MNFAIIGFLGSVFFGLTLINRTLEGKFITSSDVGFMNMLSVTQKINVGFISIPIPNVNYISGVFRMMKMDDYTFLNAGNGQLLMFALYTLSFMVGFFLFITIVSMGVNFIRGR